MLRDVSSRYIRGSQFPKSPPSLGLTIPCLRYTMGRCGCETTRNFTTLKVSSRFDGLRESATTSLTRLYVAIESDSLQSPLLAPVARMTLPSSKGISPGSKETLSAAPNCPILSRVERKQNQRGQILNRRCGEYYPELRILKFRYRQIFAVRSSSRGSHAAPSVPCFP